MAFWRNLLAGGVGLVLLVGLLSACSSTSGGDESRDTTLYLSDPSESNAQAWDGTTAQTTLTNVELADLDTAQSQAETARLIIKNGTVQLQVNDVPAASDQVTAIATRYGGYVLQTRLSNSGKRRTGTIELAVESTHFEVAVAEIQALAEAVIFVSTTGTDVTEEYVDAESRLQNLEATRDRIRTFLDSAQDVTEALAVNAELSRIEGEIEQVKGRMTYLAGRAAFSTITVDLQEEAVPEAKNNRSLGDTIDAALDTQIDLLRLLVDAGLWLVIVIGPYLVVGSGIVGFVRWRQRRRESPSAPVVEDASIGPE